MAKNFGKIDDGKILVRLGKKVEIIQGTISEIYARNAPISLFPITDLISRKFTVTLPEDVTNLVCDLAGL